ncbi:MAG: LPS assembly lipoprotein LptE [Pseudomonadota bacterium]
MFSKLFQRTFLKSSIVFILYGCSSYHLRQAPTLPFSELAIPSRPQDNLAVLSPTGNYWAEILLQELDVHTPNSNTSQGWQLKLLNDAQQRQIASIANDGTVREYRLYHRLKVQLISPDKKEEFQPISIEVFRDLPYKETQRTAKELEETKLWSDIEVEVGTRLARRIIWQLEKINLSNK